MTKQSYRRSPTPDKAVLVNSKVTTVKAVSWLTGKQITELAEDAGIDRPHLQKVANGLHPVTAKLAKKLASVTPRSCTVEFFLGQTVVLKAYRKK